MRDNHNIIAGVLKLLGKSVLGTGLETFMVMMLISSGTTEPATLLKSFVCYDIALPNPKGDGN